MCYTRGRYTVCFIILFFFLAPTLYANERIIRDMRGVAVAIPKNITSVATIDDGFVEAIMSHIGVIDTVKVIGSWALKLNTIYTFSYTDSPQVEYRGCSPMRFLHPWLDEKPCITSRQGRSLDLETLASLAPDVIILRIGDCTIGAGDKTLVKKSIESLETLGFPLIVLYAPSWFSHANLSSLQDEARIIEEIFDKQGESEELMQWITSLETLIQERTADIAASERSTVLYLGLNSRARQQGAAGTVHGTGTAESYIIENVVGATNAFQGSGAGVPLSAEQIYALDPDVIILPTSQGYHPVDELYKADYYASLDELRAIKKRQVYSLPYSPKNCARRLEYPLDMLIMAKAAYPQIFADMKVHEYALELYQRAYHIDRVTAEKVRTNQLLDWTVEQDF